jgi:hypothetical protein
MWFAGIALASFICIFELAQVQFAAIPFDSAKNDML